MKFKSAVDRWFYFVIAACLLTFFGVLLPQYFAGDMPLIPAIGLGILLLGPIGLLYTTNYTVDGDDLIIRAGVFTWNIRLSDIQSANPSSSLLSSPALSLKRIELIYKKNNRVLVSPDDPDAFLQAIGHGR